MATVSARPRTQRHGHSGHSGLIARASFHVALDTKAIAEAANDYKHYEINGRILRKLPEFDDCKDYTTENIEHATRTEIDKLVAIASDNTPPLFDSQNIFRGISQKHFEHLSEIADQLICNLVIVLHDNSRRSIQLTTIDSWVLDIMLETRRKLHSRYQQSGSFETVKGRASQVLLSKGKNYRAYLRLLDYVLGTMSWWLMRCAQSAFWDKHLIAILAKWAVKLKIIGFNPQKAATVSLNHTKKAVDKLLKAHEFRKRLVSVAGNEEKDVNEELQTEEDLGRSYHEEKMELHYYLSEIFTEILGALMTQVRSRYKPNCFEVCSLIYWARERGIANMMMGFRDENISTSSVSNHITYLHSAFQLLELNTDRMRDRHISPASHTSHVPYLKIRRSKWPGGWHFAAKPEEISIYSMDDAISLLVPLSLLHGRVAHLAGLLVEFSNKAETGDIIQRAAPPDGYFSEYVLSTRSWLEENCHTPLARTVVPDAKHLSKSPIRIGLQCTSAADSDGQQSISELRKDYDKHVEYMKKWDCRIRSVVVHCKTYSRVFQTIAVFIVIGGLFVPFGMVDWTAGIDSSEMTMVTWLLSGLVLLFAKNLTFPNWPWYGFLAGRVECTRLSDLADISGIGAQTVLLFLLQRNASMGFVTQGPYDSVFRRKLNQVQTGGFAIDEPVDLWTLMAAGIIVLKVVSIDAEYLVCLDGRRGNWEDAPQGTQGDWLACRDFDEIALEKTFGTSRSGASNEREVFTLKQTSIKLSKVLGVYVKEARFG